MGDFLTLSLVIDKTVELHTQLSLYMDEYIIDKKKFKLLD
jgi:hypothetical protein